jgi:hypothetical protein
LILWARVVADNTIGKGSHKSKSCYSMILEFTNASDFA